MTGSKKVTFEQDQLPGVDDIELEVEYTYERKEADAVSGTEVNSEIKLVDGWELAVIQAYINAGREAVRKIELDLVPDMNFDNKPRQWAEEDR